MRVFNHPFSQIRYHDPDGNPLMPNAVENPDAEPQDAVDGINTLADMADPIDCKPYSKFK